MGADDTFLLMILPFRHVDRDAESLTNLNCTVGPNSDLSIIAPLSGSRLRFQPLTRTTTMGVFKSDTVIHVTQSELDRALGALRTLGLIGDDGLSSREFRFPSYPDLVCFPTRFPGSLTMLGPCAPYLPEAESVQAKPEDEVAEAVPVLSAAKISEQYTTGLPYPCKNCGTINRPEGKKRFYAVVRARNVGVFEGWSVICRFTRQATQYLLGKMSCLW